MYSSRKLRYLLSSSFFYLYHHSHWRQTRLSNHVEKSIDEKQTDRQNVKFNFLLIDLKPGCLLKLTENVGSRAPLP